MDKDLKLSLGQQLALKNFILRLKFIANSKHQVAQSGKTVSFKAGQRSIGKKESVTAARRCTWDVASADFLSLTVHALRKRSLSCMNFQTRSTISTTQL